MPNRFFKNNLLPGVLVLFVAVLILTLRTCEPKKLNDGKAIADEMERRLVKRITNAMILQETRRVGDSLVRTTEQQILTYLKTTLDSGNFKAALQYHQLAKYTPVTAIAQKYRAVIVRTGKIWPNAATDPANLLLREQLKQYAAFNERQQPLVAQVMRVGPSELLYTKPIWMTNALCLRCHGEPTKTLSIEHQQSLPAGFTRNYAGYQPGSWAGMWYVRFQAKGILDGITQKRKKSRRGQPLFGRSDTLKK